MVKSIPQQQQQLQLQLQQGDHPSDDATLPPKQQQRRRSPPPSSSQSCSPSLGSSTFSATSIAIPFYYHTCPQFQQSDLDKERAALSAAERIEIDEDVAGTTALPRESRDFVQGRLHAFHDALVAIPPAQKESFLIAVERQSVEFVFDEESPPLAFLRAERFDATKAAQRFLNYWSLRHKIFGDDRAFRSMCPGRRSSSSKKPESESCCEESPDESDNENDDHGNDEYDEYDNDDDSGCMSGIEREAVRLGAAKALPPDAHGRVVVFFKRNCVPKEVADHRPVFLRALFYVLHVAAQDVPAQRHGFVFLYHAKVVQLTNQLRRRAKLILHLIEHCAPIRLQASHAMYPPSRSVALLVRPVMLSLASRYVRQRTVAHVGTPREHALRLELYGMSPAGIPVEFGSSASFERKN